MPTLTSRLEVAQFSIADQADYLQQLLQQFDMPYDACCSLQVTVAELRQAAEHLEALAHELAKELRRPGKASPHHRD